MKNDQKPDDKLEKHHKRISHPRNLCGIAPNARGSTGMVACLALGLVEVGA
ncbi:MAG: hypothetical protein ACYTEK_22010 [Planctomycetota bacterium]